MSTDVLHYRGDITNYDPEWMIGPDFGGRYLAIRSISTDVETGITTAKLRGIMPDEFREKVAPLVLMQRERERIRSVFNGG